MYLGYWKLTVTVNKVCDLCQSVFYSVDKGYINPSIYVGLQMDA